MGSTTHRFGARPRPLPEYDEGEDLEERRRTPTVRGSSRQPMMPLGKSQAPYKRLAEIEGSRKEPFSGDASLGSAAAREARPGEPPQGSR